MAIDESSSATTRLLTLLNVSATKASKRKRTFEESKPVEKLNKKRTVQIATPDESSGSASEGSPSEEKEKSRPEPQTTADGDVEMEDAGEEEEGTFRTVPRLVRMH